MNRNEINRNGKRDYVLRLLERKETKTETKLTPSGLHTEERETENSFLHIFVIYDQKFSIIW